MSTVKIRVAENDHMTEEDFNHLYEKVITKQGSIGQDEWECMSELKADRCVEPVYVDTIMLVDHVNGLLHDARTVADGLVNISKTLSTMFASGTLPTQ